MLDKERFEAEQRLQAADEAERRRRIDEEVKAERSRIAQAAAAEAERARQKRVRSEISVEAEAWLKALGEAEAGAARMSTALRSAFATAARINALMVAVGEKSRLSNPETADRLSRRVSALLSGLHAPHVFGHLTLFAGVVMDPDTTWPADELKHAPWLKTLKENNDDET